MLCVSFATSSKRASLWRLSATPRGWIIEADVARGRTLTSFWSIKTDARDAGGNWVDAEVLVDGKLVTSRSPDDIPAFNEKLLEELAKTPVGAARA